MNVMNINALKEAVKSLAQSLQTATIFPAGLFVLVNACFIVPLFWPEFDPTEATSITLIISATLLFSYMLYAFNFPLIRFVEGYKLTNDSFFKYLLEREKDRKAKESRERPNEVEHNFSSNKLMPTKVGNTIAAFENYPSARYCMDAIALWPRLVPVLEKVGFLDYVLQEKAVFDFILNMFFVVSFLGMELMYRALFLGHLKSFVFLAFASGLAILILYEGMYVAARQWGTVVKVAFDMHRHDLAKHLYMFPAKSFVEEQERWEAISRFYIHNDPRAHSVFIPQAKLHMFQDKYFEFEKQGEVKGC